MSKIYIYLSVISILLASCAKEQGCMDEIAINFNADAEEDDNSCNYSITGGAWIATSSIEEGDITATMMGFPLLDSSWSYTESNPDSIEPYKLKFNNDINSTYSEYDRNNIMIDNGTWSLSESNLTLFMSDTTVVVNVISVNRDECIIEIVFNESGTEDGVTFNYNISSRVTFNRDRNSFANNHLLSKKLNNKWYKKIKVQEFIEN